MITRHSIFNTISLNNLKGDIYGGLTAAVVSLPLALTFGVASGAGAEAGLYGAIIVGFFAAMFGGTPTLISEPTGPMTVIMTAVVTAMIAENPENGVEMAFTVVVVAGIFQIMLGALRLGKYVTMMPYSVISGFMSGIGIILILLQIAPFTGQESPSGGVLAVITNLTSLLRGVQLEDTLIAAAALAILFFTPKNIARFAPPQLIALVACSAVAWVFFSDSDIRKIGTISLGIPQFHIPTFTSKQINTIIIDGMILGMLGCIDSLLTSVIADSLTNKNHRSNKELIGQGIGNMLSGLFGGLPGAGSTMGTVVNIQSGAQTALSGIVRALVLIAVTLGAAELTQSIPLAVLAAIALKVGLNILDWSFIKRAHKLSWAATFIMYAVILLTVLVDLIVAVGVGVFIANILTIERLSEHHSKNSVKAISDADDHIDISTEEKDILDTAGGKILLLYFSGPLIFGMAKAISRERESIENCESLVLDLSSVPLMDATAMLAIENVINQALAIQRRVFIVCRSQQGRDALKKMNFQTAPRSLEIFTSRIEALNEAINE